MEEKVNRVIFQTDTFPCEKGLLSILADILLWVVVE